MAEEKYLLSIFGERAESIRELFNKLSWDFEVVDMQTIGSVDTGNNSTELQLPPLTEGHEIAKIVDHGLDNDGRHRQGSGSDMEDGSDNVSNDLSGGEDNYHNHENELEVDSANGDENNIFPFPYNP